MDITVRQTPDTIFPMEILQHIFSYTSNVVFRSFIDEITNKQKWRMWIISPIPNNDPRYKVVCAIPPRLKLYSSATHYNNPNGAAANMWYYSVVFRDVPNNKRFIMRSKQDTNIDVPYIIWTCFEKVQDDNAETARTPELRSSVGVRGFACEPGVSGWRPETSTGLSGDGLPSKDNEPNTLQPYQMTDIRLHHIR
jgi:hypothetical protein